MKIHFTKMHGTCDDYIVIDCREGIPFDPSRLAKEMCPRRSSVGADGIILISKSDKAVCYMRPFSADGVESKLRGNALRCAARYLYENHFTQNHAIQVETPLGIKNMTLNFKEDRITTVDVDMGIASFLPKDVPVDSADPVINEPWQYNYTIFYVTAVNVGTPHCVIFNKGFASRDMDDYVIDRLPLPKYGPIFEHSIRFPEGVNTDFVHIDDEKTLTMRTWEKGIGETYACGTGACASVAAAVRNNYCRPNTEITVYVKGGQLKVICDENYHLHMSGNAHTVYEGDYPYQEHK